MPGPYEKGRASNGTYICTSQRTGMIHTIGRERDGVKQQNEVHTHTDDVQRERV